MTKANLFNIDEDLAEQVDAEQSWSHDKQNVEICLFEGVYEIYADDEFQCRAFDFDRAVELASQYLK